MRQVLAVVDSCAELRDLVASLSGCYETKIEAPGLQAEQGVPNASRPSGSFSRISWLRPERG